MSAERFLICALDFLGSSYNEDSWRALFGISIHLMYILWLILDERCNGASIGLEPKHLFWTMYWFKNYPTNRVQAFTHGVYPETLRYYMHLVVNTFNIYFDKYGEWV